MTTRALIVVDTQVDFCEGGRLAVEGGAAAAAAITELLAQRAGDYAAIAATKDWHTPDTANHFPASRDEAPDMAAGTWPVHCMAGTPGSELHPALRLPEGTAVLFMFATGAWPAIKLGNNDGSTLGSDLLEAHFEQVQVGEKR